ncbi:unnamed protein product [Peronospora belbahrii]|uniref:Calcineurin-like phosphoesterase domain-containing protein n=1 Tax=Peronospora belbahrii TaxID=622444 RepID=A0ABN8CQ42_9STRA|nr:unnamed protein product [Peronospora belbahrii]
MVGMGLTWYSITSAAFIAAATADKLPIQARTSLDNTSLVFKILQLADLHITGIPTIGCGSSIPTGMASQDCSETLTYTFVEQLLDLEKPDFIAFTGDNMQVYDPSSHQRAIDAVTRAAEERNISYGMVLGNHDEEGSFPREKIVDMVSQKTHSYTVSGPKTVNGVGNYMLNVTAPIRGVWGDINTTVFRMYSWTPVLKPRQRNTPVMFFHIPLVEFSYSKDGCNGDQLERVHNQGMNLRLLSALSEINEIKAVFVGHDHVNEYCCLVDGVQLCYGGGAGFGRAYSAAGFSRRARVVEWTVDSDERHVIRSWKRHFDDINVVRSEEVLYSEL